MDTLDSAILHINVSTANKIDKETFVSCIKGPMLDEVWSYHVHTFFLETDISIMHNLVLDEFFSFSELFKAHKKWDPQGIAKSKTTEWVEEMFYLSIGRADKIDINRLV